MFRNTYQHGLLSVFYSCGANPLLLWDIEVHNGHVKRITDKEVNSVVLELMSTNVATTYISCPKGNQTLGIKLPFLVMIVKNMRRYFSFEITIFDDKNMRRRFRISNFQSTTKIKPFCTTMPLALSHGWNQIQFNLADFTSRAYASNFLETVRLQIHANVRVRRIYFCDKLYTENELPQEYKLYLPIENKARKVYVAKTRPKELSKSKPAETPEIQEDLQEVQDKDEEDVHDVKVDGEENVKSAEVFGVEVVLGEEYEAPLEIVPSKTSSADFPAIASVEVIPSKSVSIIEVTSKTESPEKVVSGEQAPPEDASTLMNASAEALLKTEFLKQVDSAEKSLPENASSSKTASDGAPPPATAEEVDIGSDAVPLEAVEE